MDLALKRRFSGIGEEKSHGVVVKCVVCDLFLQVQVQQLAKQPFNVMKRGLG